MKGVNNSECMVHGPKNAHINQRSHSRGDYLG